MQMLRFLRAAVGALPDGFELRTGLPSVRKESDFPVRFFTSARRFLSWVRVSVRVGIFK